MKQKGSALIMVAISLLILVAATVSLMQSYQWRVNTKRERLVVQNAVLTLNALDDYFLAECSATGSSAVTAPGSVDELIDQGYLPARNYSNPYGSPFAFDLSHAGDGTILSVSFTVRDAEQAQRLSHYGSTQATADATGVAVRFSRRTSQFDASDYRQDAIAFEGPLTCI